MDSDLKALLDPSQRVRGFRAPRWGVMANVTATITKMALNAKKNHVLVAQTNRLTKVDLRSCKVTEVSADVGFAIKDMHWNEAATKCLIVGLDSLSKGCLSVYTESTGLVTALKAAQTPKFYAVRWIPNQVGYATANCVLISGINATASYLALYNADTDVLTSYTTVSGRSVILEKIEIRRLASGMALITTGASVGAVQPIAIRWDVKTGRMLGVINIGSVSEVVYNLTPRYGTNNWIVATSANLYTVDETLEVPTKTTVVGATYGVALSSDQRYLSYTDAWNMNIFDLDHDKLLYTSPYSVGETLSQMFFSVDGGTIYYADGTALANFTEDAAIPVRSDASMPVYVNMSPDSTGRPGSGIFQVMDGSSSQLATVLLDALQKGRLAVDPNYAKPVEVYEGTGAPAQTYEMKYDPVDPTDEPLLVARVAGVDTPLTKVTSLTGIALGFTYNETTHIVTFGNGTNGFQPADHAVAGDDVQFFYVPAPKSKRTKTLTYTHAAIGTNPNHDDAVTQLDMTGCDDITIQTNTKGVTVATTATTTVTVHEGHVTAVPADDANGVQIETTVAYNIVRPPVCWTGSSLYMTILVTVGTVDYNAIDYCTITVQYNRVYRA